MPYIAKLIFSQDTGGMEDLLQSHVALFPILVNLADGLTKIAEIEAAFNTIKNDPVQNYGWDPIPFANSHITTLNEFPPDPYINGIDNVAPDTGGIMQFLFVANQIKAKQSYRIRKLETSQSLCTTQQLGYTKISSFRKFILP